MFWMKTIAIKIDSFEKNSTITKENNISRKMKSESS